jgi:hypothetical protein
MWYKYHRQVTVMPEHPAMAEAAASYAVNVNNVIDTLIGKKGDI